MEILVNILGMDDNILTILKELKNGRRRFVDLAKSGINRTTLSRKLKLLGTHHLIEYKKNFVTGEEGYVLTPLGRQILEKLEEIEQIYEEWKKKQPPEDKEEFLKWRRVED